MRWVGGGGGEIACKGERGGDSTCTCVYNELVEICKTKTTLSEVQNPCMVIDTSMQHFRQFAHG